MANEINILLKQLVDKSYDLSRNINEMKTALIKAENLIGIKTEQPELQEIIQQSNLKVIEKQNSQSNSQIQTNESFEGMNEEKAKAGLFHIIKHKQVVTTNENKKAVKPEKPVSKLEAEQNIIPPSKEKNTNVTNPSGSSTSSVTELTPLQKLLNLVNEKGQLTTDEAAKLLNNDTSLIETWARILDSNNLIKLQYPPIGKPVLTKV